MAINAPDLGVRLDTLRSTIRNLWWATNPKTPVFPNDDVDEQAYVIAARFVVEPMGSLKELLAEVETLYDLAAEIDCSDELRHESRILLDELRTSLKLIELPKTLLGYDEQSATPDQLRAITSLAHEIFGKVAFGGTFGGRMCSVARALRVWLPVDPKERKPESAETAYRFNVTNEFAFIEGFGEKVTLQRTEGVQRLHAILTSPRRRVPVLELARIGLARAAPADDSVDRDSGLVSRKSVNDDRPESRLGKGSSDALRQEIADLITTRNEARERGDSAEAQRMTEQINAVLDPMKTDRTKAITTVRNSLNRTYERIRESGGTVLAKHFEQFVRLPRKESDFIYAPDESKQKVFWTTNSTEFK